MAQQRSPRAPAASRAHEARLDVAAALRRLLHRRDEVQTSDVSALTGTTRQAVQRQLRKMLESGELVAEGSGPATRYRYATRVVRELPLATTAEDRAWTAIVEPALDRFGAVSKSATSALHYAFTELVNNAVEHSGGRRIGITVERAGPRIAIEVEDDGIGVFARLRRGLGLPDDLASLKELSKGKTTTMPERHTGEGIFFRSKAGDAFEIDSGGLRWVVDNVRDDMAVGVGSQRAGTRVRFEIERDSTRRLEELFERYAPALEFSKSRIGIKLFSIGTVFMSRSEARRLLHGLEKLREVLLDFEGVEMVGQGFADEVFRVWASAHPTTRLIPERMIRPVAFMVERARR